MAKYMFCQSGVRGRRLAHVASFWRSCALLCCMLFFLPVSYAEQLDAELDLKGFVHTHCSRCHGAEEQNGDRRFDVIQTDLADEETLRLWQEVVDAMNAGEMPPEGEPAPPAAQTKRFIAAVTRRLKSAYETRADRFAPRFRRLNRHEYRNTIRDLCGVSTESFDPTASFPADERLDGFENIGEQLIISDYLMQR